MHADGIDEVDHLPVWQCVPGADGAGGCVAVERLGVGHRTETWLAWSRELWCPVVVKLARPDQTRHPRALATLRREVAALAGVTHPALPALVAAASTTTSPTSSPSTSTGRPSTRSSTSTGPSHRVTPPCSARSCCRRSRCCTPGGLAHLDVKPENVVLRDGRPVLIDFGSARRLGSRQPPGRPVGTVGYAAPEMEACEPVSAAMDLFGLGTVLAEAVTGIPFTEGPRLPRSRLGRLTRRLLDDDPATRGSVRDVLMELAQACGARRPWPPWLDARTARVRAG